MDCYSHSDGPREPSGGHRASPWGVRRRLGGPRGTASVGRTQGVVGLSTVYGLSPGCRSVGLCRALSELCRGSVGALSVDNCRASVGLCRSILTGVGASLGRTKCNVFPRLPSYDSMGSPPVAPGLGIVVAAPLVLCQATGMPPLAREAFQIVLQSTAVSVRARQFSSARARYAIT